MTQQAQGKPGARLTVAGRREVDSRELAEVGDGGVGTKDLEQEEPQDADRREQPFTPA